MIWILCAVAVLPVLLIGCQQVRLSPQPALQERPETALRIATWNVHYIWLEQAKGPWGLSGWAARQEAMDATFKAIDADIIGFQEMESFSRRGDGNVNLKRDFLLTNNPDYAAAATGDARVLPPTQPIFYRHDRLSVLDEGWFHFSETPDQLYSRGFDGASPSFASWALFEASGQKLRVINIHPDAFSRVNRRASHALVAQRIAPWVSAGERVILLGDFNALQGSRYHQQYQALGLHFPKVPGSTYHLNRGLHVFGAIDHIGIGPGIDAGAATVFNQKLSDVWPSDHHPVLLDVEFP